MLRVQPVFIQPIPDYNNYTKRKQQEESYYSGNNNLISDYNPNDGSKLVNVFNKEKLLQDYKTSQEYFNYNFDHKKPIFGTVEDFKLIETNPLVKLNFCKFMVEKSSSELEKLFSSEDYSPETDFKIKGYTQLYNFFKEYLELLEEDKYDKKTAPVFLGGIAKDEERYCKNLVHGFAAACSLISAGAGAFSLGSTDVYLLRPLQGIMFLKMQDYLQVPFWAAAEYTAKEMFSAAVIGTEGAKILVDVGGWVSHAASVATGASLASGGGTNAGIAKASAAAHGSLSFMLTEKMGRGFLKRVRENNMTLKQQSIEFASYFGLRAALGGIGDLSELFNLGSNTISDSFDPEMIKHAYENIPKSDKEIISSVMGLLEDYNATKLGYSFAFNFGAKMLANFNKFKNNENVNVKQLAQDAFKDAFMLTAIYDFFDFGVGEVISHNAAESIKEMQNNIEAYPDAFKVFKESEHRFWKEIDLDNLDEKSFRELFTNKSFLSNISIMTKEQIKEFNEAWLHRKDSIHREEVEKIQASEKKLNKNNQDLESKNDELSTEDFKNVLKKYLEPGGILNPKKGFGYGRLAGYKHITERLTSEFITPVLMEKEKSSYTPPAGILFYGPTSTGKTVLASAVIEQSMSNKVDSIESFLPDDFIYKKLCQVESQAKERFALKKERTIIQIDEIEGMRNKPKSLAKMKELISDGENRISIFGTTNCPDKVDDDLVQNFIKIYVGPANINDIESIMKYYLEDYAEKLDLNKICENLDSNPAGRFSNNQLKILCGVIKKGNMNSDKVISMINKMKPEITSAKLATYNGGNTYG